MKETPEAENILELLIPHEGPIPLLKMTLIHAVADPRPCLMSMDCQGCKDEEDCE